MSVAEPGSTQRAFAAWRATASAMLVLWTPLPFATPWMVRGNTDGFGELAFVIVVALGYCAGVLVVLPLFVFTAGRWIDRRTAPQGLRKSVFMFGVYGFGFAIVLTWLLIPTGLGPLGIAALLVLPTAAAVAGRLLVEFAGRVWTAVLWLTWALAVALALALLGAIFLNGG